jgi:WhiB family redox-sensing transcriptional regulator
MNRWRERAVCREYHPETWFPVANRRKGTREKNVQRAITLCRQCPVRVHCARAALNINARTGIWAGVDLGDEARPRPTRKTAALRFIANQAGVLG